VFRPEFTILIQGPANTTSLDKVEKYLQVADVVVSTWDIQDEEDEELKDCLLRLPKECKTLINDLPEIKNTVGCDKQSTFYYALKSMHYGLKEINTDYVIKTRSDEWFETFDPFLSKLNPTEDKIVCGSIFVRKDSPFHFGDHIFVGKTKFIRSAVEKLVSRYEATTQEPLEGWMVQGSLNVAESILCRAILEQMGVDLSRSEKEVFLENIEIVDVNEVERFICRWHQADKTYLNEFTNHHGVRNNDDYRRQ
jgi:hypothetical protein